jgi:hypothetical protein
MSSQPLSNLGLRSLPPAIASSNNFWWIPTSADDQPQLQAICWAGRARRRLTRVLTLRFCSYTNAALRAQSQWFLFRGEFRWFSEPQKRRMHGSKALN